MARILVVDDDPAIRFTLEELLRKQSHEVQVAASGEEALEHLEDVDLVVTDLAMPAMDGLELLRIARERVPSVPVLLLTAFGSERIAVNAIKAGAYDYLAKPFDNDEFRFAIERALEALSLKRENRKLVAEHALGRRFIGESPALRRLLDAVARVASRDVTVLVRGETGTGKEMIASLVHAQSPRARGPIVRFNCAALPDDLAEAELFGHSKGAFTGASSARTGYFAQADGGTLVLDEVGELSSAVQAKLLRAVQEGEIQPLGSSAIQRVDVRIIASTNRDLAAQVQEGRFREDLYYRLAVVEFVVPPLRDRPEDIGPLAREFARRYADRFGLDSAELPAALVARLEAMRWPGNVRQLENTVARLAALSRSTFQDADLGMLEPSSQPPPAGPTGGSLKEEVEAFERQLLVRALAGAGGNMSEAARQLGIGRATLFDKLHKYELDPKGRPKGDE
jgi:two-component system, NtrC family, response regulator AtoC